MLEVVVGGETRFTVTPLLARLVCGQCPHRLLHISVISARGGSLRRASLLYLRTLPWAFSKMNDRNVVIVSAARTPIGSFCGSLSSLKASDLGSIVIKSCLSRVKQLQPDDISEVIMGQVLTTGMGQNPPRQAAIKAGIPVSVPVYQVNMICGSGLRSVIDGYSAIKCGDSNVVIAGGQESMSRAPHAAYLRNATKLGNHSMIDTILHDGLTDAFSDIHMGITAEIIASKYGINREEQDAYALESQQRAAAAVTNGYFVKEIIPVAVPVKKDTVHVSADEFPKPDTTIESLQKLKPVFKPENGGTVTAGNASGMNDGAAAVILMTEDMATSKGIPVLARIVAMAQVGVEPSLMCIGPVGAIQLLLKKANWTKDEVDLYELNEAFAAQSLACIRELNIDPSKVNVNGGAIALGHPIGASGTRILVTLLYALERTGGKKGVAALCIGGGMGIAIAIERK